MNLNHQPVFVVGAARSGTTFVQSLLSALPGFYSCPETHFFDELMAHGSVCGGYQLHRPRLDLPPAVGEVLLLESFKKADAGFLHIPEQAKDDLLQRARSGRLTPREYLCTLIESGAPVNGKSGRWVEKTPIHASYLKEIFSLFPDARIVCLHRRAEGVLASAVSTFGIPACIAALDYYRCYRDVKRFLEQEPAREKQLFHAYYEELVQSDEALEALLKFLQAEDAPSAASLRLAVRDQFLELYGSSAMAPLQAGMNSASAVRKVGGWRLRAIDGYAGILNRRFPPKHEERALPGKQASASLAAMTLDLLLGILYIIEWRMRCLLNRLKSTRMVGR